MATSWKIVAPKPTPFAPNLPVMAVTVTADTDDPEVVASIESAATAQGITLERVAS